jgi:hypothetical protein
MDVLYGVRMAGPLAPYARGLAGEMTRLGFTELSARGQLGLAAHLSRWLEAAGLGTAELTGPTVEAYLAARRASGYTAYLTPKALAPLLGWPGPLGVSARSALLVLARVEPARRLADDSVPVNRHPQFEPGGAGRVAHHADPERVQPCGLAVPRLLRRPTQVRAA